jgi:hypothetical protein
MITYADIVRLREQSLAPRDISQRIEKIAQGTEENTVAATQTAILPSR